MYINRRRSSKKYQTYPVRTLTSFSDDRFKCIDDWSIILSIKFSLTGDGREISSSEEVGSINKIHIYTVI